ncbi:hypothetical protein OUZ56_020382 [Daphnia magna]|uniref:Uncharacterized protein n=1 Tax=Daphnia magna TaxID=35525 RepID=A0ABQ9ZEL3_9CRUS|nr:hypothetical protein OUZ56_020382 [Daphnia magna]
MICPLRFPDDNRLRSCRPICCNIQPRSTEFSCSIQTTAIGLLVATIGIHQSTRHRKNSENNRDAARKSNEPFYIATLCNCESKDRSGCGKLAWPSRRLPMILFIHHLFILNKWKIKVLQGQNLIE